MVDLDLNRESDNSYESQEIAVLQKKKKRLRKIIIANKGQSCGHHPQRQHVRSPLMPHVLLANQMGRLEGYAYWLSHGAKKEGTWELGTFQYKYVRIFIQERKKREEKIHLEEFGS